MLERDELSRAVAAVAALPEAQRKALVDSAIEGRTHDQIAAELGTSAGSVRGLIHRGRVAVRGAVGALVPFPVVAWAAGSGGAVAGGVAAGSAAGGSLAAQGRRGRGDRGACDGIGTGRGALAQRLGEVRPRGGSGRDCEGRNDRPRLESSPTQGGEGTERGPGQDGGRAAATRTAAPTPARASKRTTRARAAGTTTTQVTTAGTTTARAREAAVMTPARTTRGTAAATMTTPAREAAMTTMATTTRGQGSGDDDSSGPARGDDDSSGSSGSGSSGSGSSGSGSGGSGSSAPARARAAAAPATMIE